MSTSRTRLLVVADTYLPRWDGMARVLACTLPRLTETFDVRLLVPDYAAWHPNKVRPNLPGVELILMRLIPGLAIAPGIGLPWLDAALVRQSVEWADICFTHSAGPLGAAVLHFAYEGGVPVASFVHSVEWDVYGAHAELYFGRRGGDIFRWLWLAILRHNYHPCRARVLMVPSPSTRSALTVSAVGGSTDGAAIQVVELGVDAARFVPLPTPTARAMRKEELGRTRSEI